MLSQIRERATGWIAWAIVIIITIPFALWGINSYFEGAAAVVVATVDDAEIDYDTYQQALSERRRSLIQLMGRSVDAEFFSSPEFKRQVVEGIIDDMLLTRTARSRGYVTSDEMLAMQIRSLPYFQEDGGFSSERYRNVLMNAGMSVAQFEEQQRRQTTVDQALATFSDTAFVTDSEVDRLIRILDERRQADYVLVDAGRYLDSIEPADEDIRAEWERNKERHVAPARMKVRYLELSVTEIAAGIEVAEEELERLYESGRDRYTDPGSRQVSHILIEVAEDAGDEDVEAARNRAMEIAEQAREGADFADLARLHSDDSGSAGAGGDLGTIERGAMVKPFEDAAFALDADEVGDPVRTRFGFHVIKVTRIEPPVVRPFAEVRAEILDRERHRQAETLYLEQVEQLRNLAFEQPDSLEPAAAELGLGVRVSDWFERDAGSGIAASEAVREAAFGDDVLRDEVNSDVIEVSADSVVVLRKHEHEAARQRELSEVRDEIAASLRQHAAQERANAEGQRMLERLRAGGSWQELVEGEGLPVRELPQVRRDVGLPLEGVVLDEVFRAAPPEGGETFGGTTVDGGYVVFRLNAVEPGDPAAADRARREELRVQLQRRRGIELATSYRDELRRRAEVRIFEDRL